MASGTSHCAQRYVKYKKIKRKQYHECVHFSFAVIFKVRGTFRSRMRKFSDIFSSENFSMSSQNSFYICLILIQKVN